MAMTGQVA